MKKSLYIHIPFCKAKCHYCDFVSFARCESQYESYVNALCQELEQRSTELQQDSIRTIFIGGGTPTVLSEHQIAKIMDTLVKNYNILEDCEISMESNPGTLTQEKIDYIGRSPINRISMGLQSTHDQLLKRLGRIHSYEVFNKNYEDLRKAGISNINVDLMFGLPDQNLAQFKESLQVVASLSPEHISAYGLIVEEGTPFYKAYEQDRLPLPQEEVERNMYHLCNQFLGEQGYKHYEISNYAKPSRECRHNMVYWQLEDYVGFGVSAHSYHQGYRYENTSSLDDYLKQADQGEFISYNKMQVDSKSLMEEFMFLGLRLLKGVERESFQHRFGRSIEEVYQGKIEKLCGQDLLMLEKGRYHLTKRGLDLSNQVLSDFLLD